MKSAYELAMERLEESGPSAALTDEQKKELADIDAVHDAKRAEREIFVKGQLEKARAAGDFEAIASLEKQLVSDRKSIEAEREAKKEKVRGGQRE